MLSWYQEYLSALTNAMIKVVCSLVHPLCIHASLVHPLCIRTSLVHPCASKVSLSALTNATIKVERHLVCVCVCVRARAFFFFIATLCVSLLA